MAALTAKLARRTSLSGAMRCAVECGVKRIVLLACAALAPAGMPAAAPAPAAVLTSAREVRALSPEEAKEQRPVKLRAVVNATDPGRTIFVQDATGGTFINRSGAVTDVTPGDVLEVEGVTAAVPVTYDDLLGGKWHYHRVAIGGVVRSLVQKV